MPTPAPVLCGRRKGDSHAQCESGTTPAVHTAYALWQEHHNVCKQCSQQDWFMPGGVLLDIDPLYEDGHMMVSRNGKLERMSYKRGADLTVLCISGALLFRRWVRETVREPAKVGGVK